jgi:hypothetical protein
MKLKSSVLQLYRRLGNRAPEVIIAGNQKSGTTAIAKLLGHATGKTVQNDIPSFWPPRVYEYLKGERKIGDFISQHKRYFCSEIVKEPNLTFFLEDLVNIFPKTKFVFIVRDPRDNIRSILNRRGIPGDLENLNFDELRIDSTKTYICNPFIWKHQDGHYISQQALKWIACVESYSIVKDRVNLLRYEDFNRNKVETIKSLADALELNVINSINDIKDVAFQPKGDTEISWQKFYNRRNLIRIEKICADRMVDYNYYPVT